MVCESGLLLVVFFLEEFTIGKKNKQEMVYRRDSYNYEAGKEKVSFTKNAGENERKGDTHRVQPGQHGVCSVLQILLLSPLWSKPLPLGYLSLKTQRLLFREPAGKSLTDSNGHQGT